MPGIDPAQAHLRFAGFFAQLGRWALRWSHAPRRVLILTVWLSGAISVLFVNDTACLMLTPLVLASASGSTRGSASRSRC